ncbi:hypothetical protein ACWKW4_08050 [Hydrogenophaga borbori]
MGRIKNHNWMLEHRHDPDNWLRIPEFGVRPADVNFEGFEVPILGEYADEFPWKVPVFEVVHSVRDEARERFKTLKQLKAEYSVTLNSAELMLEPNENPAAWTSRQMFAAKYFWFFHSIELAIGAYESSEHQLEAMAYLANGLRVAFHLRDDDASTIEKARSEIARIAASSRHRENHAMRDQVFAWLDQHKTPEMSLEKAAEAMAGKLVPLSYRAVRDHCTAWNKLRRAGRP